MSDTPRTDGAECKCCGRTDCYEILLTASRQLERELNEAIAKPAALQRQLEQTIKDAATIAADRDHWKQRAEAAEKLYQRK